MTENKRFTIVHLRNLDMCDIQDTAQKNLTFYNDLGSPCSVKPLCDLLNELNDENNTLREEIKDFQDLLASKEEVYLKPIIRTIEEAYENERTHIGKNVLKQLLQSLE